MPTYIILNKLTDQGARAIKDSPQRSIAAQEEARKLGGKLTLYYVFQEYITIGILEVPSDEAAFAFASKLQSLGNVTMLTLKAFTIDEAARIMSGKLPVVGPSEKVTEA